MDQSIDFECYLKERYDFIELLPAVRIGCKEFGLSIKTSKRVWKKIYA